MSRKKKARKKTPGSAKLLAGRHVTDINEQMGKAVHYHEKG